METTAIPSGWSQDFQKLPEALEQLHVSGRKLCIVSDSNVDTLYGTQLKEVLSGICGKVTSYVFPAGEEHKTLDTVRNLYEHLILEKFDLKRYAGCFWRRCCR